MSNSPHTESQTVTKSVSRDALFREVVEALQPGLARLCHGYEADPAERQDLLQEILTEIWRSLLDKPTQVRLLGTPETALGVPVTRT